MSNSETSTIANIGDVPLSAPEPYLYYTYPKECLDFHFDVWNETDNFIRVLKVNQDKIRSIKHNNNKSSVCCYLFLVVTFLSIMQHFCYPSDIAQCLLGMWVFLIDCSFFFFLEETYSFVSKCYLNSTKFLLLYSILCWTKHMFCNLVTLVSPDLL